jgi:hypothetical protein
MKRLLSTIVFCAIAASAPAHADSDLSTGLSVGSAVVLAGPLSVLAGAGSIVVASVETVADGVVLVLKNSATGSQAVVKLGAQGAKGLSLAAGSVVEVTVMSTGYLLGQSGKAIAFIPNEIGKSLLHHSAVAGAGQ